MHPTCQQPKLPRVFFKSQQWGNHSRRESYVSPAAFPHGALGGSVATTRRRDPTGAEKHQPLQETTVTLLLSCKPYSRLLHHSVLSPETQALPSGKSPSPDACLGSVLQCGANPFLPQTNANGGGESRGRAGTPRGDAAFNTPAKNTERPPLLPGSCPQAAVSCWGKPSRGQGGSSTGVEGGLTAPPPKPSIPWMDLGSVCWAQNLGGAYQ